VLGLPRPYSFLVKETVFVKKIIPILLLILICNGPAYPADSDMSLNLGEAIKLVLAHNSELEAFRLSIKSQQALLKQSHSLPSPELEWESEKDGDENTVKLSQDIELGGKRKNRIKIAKLVVDVANNDYQIKRSQLLQQTIHAYANVIQHQALLDLAQEKLDTNNSLLSSIKKLVEKGRFSRVEEKRALTLVSQSKLDLTAAQQHLLLAKESLRAMWGSNTETMHALLTYRDDLFHLKPIEIFEEQLQHSFILKQNQLEIEQAKLGVSLERSTRVTNLNISGGINYDNDTDEETTVLGIAMPIGVFNRNSGNIDSAKWTLSQKEKEYEAMTIKTHLKLKKLHTKLKTIHQQATALKTDILPNANSVYETVYDGYMKGKYAYLDVLEAQKNMFELRQQALSYYVDYHTFYAELLALIGQDLAQYNFEGDTYEN